MSLLDYPVNGPAYGGPPRHWVTPFNADDFKLRQAARKRRAELARNSTNNPHHHVILRDQPATPQLKNNGESP